MALIPAAFATAMGMIFLLVSLAIRWLMRRVEARMPAPVAGEEFRANCLLVKNLFRMPGVVVVAGDRLMLTPVLGRPFEVPLTRVQRATESQWFNGNLMMVAARGFVFSVPGFCRLGIALDNPAPFRAVLDRHAVRFN